MISNTETIKMALTTWYPKNHLLHYNLHHPLGKLVGEWGELLDDYMKSIYKPGCKWQPLNELVDVWYYIRILAYQIGLNLETIFISNNQMDYLIASAVEEISYVFKAFTITPLPDTLNDVLIHNYSVLSRICELSNLTIDQLTEASWEKLKPGSERGEEWMKGRADNEQK